MGSKTKKQLPKPSKKSTSRSPKEAGVFFAEPSGLSDDRIIWKAKEFAKTHDFKYGDLLADYVIKIGGCLVSTKYRGGNFCHFRNFENFDNRPLPKNPKIKFYLNIEPWLDRIEPNYIMAHFLGHYVLHCPKDKKIFIYYQNVDSPFDIQEKIDQQAEVFAMNLLTPEMAFREEWRRSKKIEEMSKIFKVSSLRIIDRLLGLGLDVN